jgi:hypothetical protein
MAESTTVPSQAKRILLQKWFPEPKRTEVIEHVGDPLRGSEGLWTARGASCKVSVF